MIRVPEKPGRVFPGGEPGAVPAIGCGAGVGKEKGLLYSRILFPGI
jgi:hypothetical protein